MHAQYHFALSICGEGCGYGIVGEIYKICQRTVAKRAQQVRKFPAVFYSNFSPPRGVTVRKLLVKKLLFDNQQLQID